MCICVREDIEQINHTNNSKTATEGSLNKLYINMNEEGHSWQGQSRLDLTKQSMPFCRPEGEAQNAKNKKFTESSPWY